MNLSHDGAGGVPGRASGSGGLARWAGALAGLLSLAACASPAPTPVASIIEPARAHAASSAGDPFYAGRLTGLGPKELLTLLGAPNLRRSDPPAELWQYRGTGCVLELYLYRDGDGYRVVRSEVHGRLLGAAACTAPPRAVPVSLRRSG